MLQLVLGRAGSGKTRYLRELLVEKSKTERKSPVMLVPEQYSFETEKAFLQLAGPVEAGKIQVLSFTRLAEAVFRREGGFAGRRLTDGGRRVLMSRAVEACEDQFETYTAAAKNGRITELMLTAVDEMKLCGISPEDLARTARLLEGKGLGKKLSELSLIYGAFDALVEASYLDSRDDLTRLAEALKTSDFFEDTVVAVDSFEGFTAQEMRVLIGILRRAKKVIVSLCTDDLPDEGTGLFALVNRTKERLLSAAREHEVPVEPNLFLTGAPRYQNEELKLLEAQLFRAWESLSGERAEKIHLFCGKDPSEEVEYCAATIRNLVEEEGYHYRDFTIVSRLPERYSGILGAELEKRQIPCFLSQPNRVDAEPVCRFLLGAFQAVQSGFATADLLEMLKTGVSGFDSQEISDLENYAFLWRLKGRDWREDFTRHPKGFGREWTEEDREELMRLDGLRSRLISPLLRFSAGTGDASGEEISQAAYDLLSDYGVSENLIAYCGELSGVGEQGLADKQVRVWELLMETLDQMHSILGSRKISRERYYSLLREVISAEDVSQIPQTVDQVIFGAPEQVRQSSPRVTLLLGAAQGEFPLAPRPSGMFSDTERRELIALDLPLGDPLEQRALEERYLAYSVACSPSDRLYVSYPRRAGGEEKEPGELLSCVQAVFPGTVIESALADEYFANSREAAFSRMAARYRDNTPQAAALRALFSEDPRYEGRLLALERAGRGGSDRIGDPALSRELFGRAPYLSATQIETYHDCKFRYFCRYGLNVQERRPAQVDVMQYGTLMHFLFEKIFSTPPEERSLWSEEELQERVEKLIFDYAEENLGGFSQLGSREQYRLKRMTRSAVLLIRHVEEELRQSKFKPEYFELHLGSREAFPPLKVETGDGESVLVGGTIDRVDVYREGKNRYVRVVDYKTGKKDFHLSDVLHGLNMQMLIYLAALAESGKVIPVGVLYMPAAEPSVSVPKGMEKSAAQKEAGKSLRMSGMVLKNSEIIAAMEAGAQGRFIPAALNKNGEFTRGSSVLEEGELSKVLNYSKRLIATMVQELYRGNVEALPNLSNQRACRFCPYQAVCAKEYTDKDIVKEKLSSGEVLEKMDAAAGGGQGEGEKR